MHNFFLIFFLIVENLLFTTQHFPRCALSHFPNNAAIAFRSNCVNSRWSGIGSAFGSSAPILYIGRWIVGTLPFNTCSIANSAALVAIACICSRDNV